MQVPDSAAPIPRSGAENSSERSCFLCSWAPGQASSVGSSKPVFGAPGRLAKPRWFEIYVLLGAWFKSRLARVAEDQKLSSACFYSRDPKISQAGSPTSVCVGLLDVHHNSKAVGHISSARPISGCLESEASTLMDQECYEGLSSGTPSL